MTQEPPRPPAGLQRSGRVLWRAVLRDYELADHERALLLQAARTADLLDDLEAELRRTGAIVESPQGSKANPAAVEARQQRITFARLIVALRIPVEDTAAPQRTQARPVRGVYGLRDGAS